MTKYVDLAIRHAPLRGTTKEPMRFRNALTAWRFGGALRAGRLALVYQPKVAMVDGRPLGAEALIRWHDRRGLVPTGEFIHLIERTRRAKRLDAFVLSEAARQVRVLCEAGVPHPIAVNLSPTAFGDVAIVARIEDLIERCDLPAGSLQIEMTERALDEGEIAIEVIERLAAAGIGVTLDDFGIGFSSLERLVRLRLEGMKIDRSFVRALETHERAAAVVYSAAELAHALELTITAEGIEDAHTWHRLRALGVDYAQGYLIARPISGDDLVEWFKQNDQVMMERRSGGDRRHLLEVRPAPRERRAWRERRTEDPPRALTPA